MALQQISVNLSRAGAQHQLRFELDSEKDAQRSMLKSFSTNTVYEAETMDLVSALLTPGDSFIDIGAHVGFFSVFAAMCVGVSGRVFAFEPEIGNYRQLLANLALNGLQNVQPFHWAVGGESKIVDFYFNADCDGGHALWDPGKIPNNTQSRLHPSRSQVFQVRLDDLFAHSSPGSVKLIKIDTEGNEVHILRGARQFLARARVPAVIAEAHGFGLRQLGTTERDMRELMAGLGYIPYLLAAALPTRLTPEQYLRSKYVFNLLYASPELQNAVADKWPQSTSIEDVMRSRGEL